MRCVIGGIRYTHPLCPSVDRRSPFTAVLYRHNAICMHSLPVVTLGLDNSRMTGGGIALAADRSSCFSVNVSCFQPPGANRFHQGRMVALGLVGIGKRKFSEG